MRIRDWSSDVCSSDLELMRVTFIHADGKERTEVEAEPGSILLDVAQAHMMPLEGTCEGQLACSTCHVIVAKADFARLSSEERRVGKACVRQCRCVGSTYT